jgi:hypothetical protein
MIKKKSRGSPVNFRQKKKLVKKKSSLKVKKEPKTPSAYSQLRKQVRQEEKFLFLQEKASFQQARKNNPAIGS